MVIDEPGRDDESGRIDLLGALSRQSAIPRDLHHAAVPDPEVSCKAVGARPVNDGAADDHQVEGCAAGAGRRRIARRLRHNGARGERQPGREPGREGRETADHGPLVLVCARFISHTGTPFRL